jgi:hypothetical protein
MVYLVYKESETDDWFLVYRQQQHAFSVSLLCLVARALLSLSRECAEEGGGAKRLMAHRHKVLTVLRHAFPVLTIQYTQKEQQNEEQHLSQFYKNTVGMFL